MGSSVFCNFICPSGLGGKEDNKKLSHNTREKSVLLEFINFELVVQCEYVKQLGKNKCTYYVIMIVFSD